ncbi:MAG: response regulator, partial [Chitinophagaceae bacterium]
DDPDDRDMVKDVIQKTGRELTVIEAKNGREALLYLRSQQGRENPPMLIILDINMPVLDGRETVAILKSEPETETIPIVIFTTSNSEKDKTFSSRFNLPMITKPPTYDKLKAVIHQMLAMVP